MRFASFETSDAHDISNSIFFLVFIGFIVVMFMVKMRQACHRDDTTPIERPDDTSAPQQNTLQSFQQFPQQSQNSHYLPPINFQFNQQPTQMAPPQYTPPPYASTSFQSYNQPPPMAPPPQY